MSPPRNANGYSTVARFESDVAGEQGHWSVILEMAAELRGPECIRASVRFLAPNAPARLLAERERFELIEGEKNVAKGVVLPNQIEPPATVNEFEIALLG